MLVVGKSCHGSETWSPRLWSGLDTNPLWFWRRAFSCGFEMGGSRQENSFHFFFVYFFLHLPLPLSLKVFVLGKTPVTSLRMRLDQHFVLKYQACLVLRRWLMWWCACHEDLSWSPEPTYIMCFHYILACACHFNPGEAEAGGSPGLSRRPA